MAQSRVEHLAGSARPGRTRPPGHPLPPRPEVGGRLSEPKTGRPRAPLAEDRPPALQRAEQPLLDVGSSSAGRGEETISPAVLKRIEEEGRGRCGCDFHKPDPP